MNPTPVAEARAKHKPASQLQKSMVYTMVLRELWNFRAPFLQ